MDTLAEDEKDDHPPDDQPYELQNLAGILAVDDEDDLDFVCFQTTYINLKKANDDMVNNYLDDARRWPMLEKSEQRDISRGTYFDRRRRPYHLVVYSNDGLDSGYKLNQHPLL